MITNLTTSQKSTRTNTSWRLGDDRHVKFRSGFIAKDNTAGTVTGKVLSGTILGRVTATNELRPVGLQVATTTGANTVHTVEDASVFLVGDVVSTFQSDGTTLISAALTIDAIDYATNQLTFSASTTLTADAIVKRDDGSGDAVGISWLDATTYKGPDESGESIHGRGAVGYYVDAWIDWSKKVIGKNSHTLAALLALNFTIENQS